MAVMHEVLNDKLGKIDTNVESTTKILADFLNGTEPRDESYHKMWRDNNSDSKGVALRIPFLAKQAKDLGSTAVLTALLLAAGLWAPFYGQSYTNFSFVFSFRSGSFQTKYDIILTLWSF